MVTLTLTSPITMERKNLLVVKKLKKDVIKVKHLVANQTRKKDVAKKMETKNLAQNQIIKKKNLLNKSR